MATAIAVLVFVTLLVWLSAARPSLPRLSPSEEDRQLAELRAHVGARADVHL
ncbi:hypothetical protein [Pseudonocardia sp. TRM90224]|uniref:hypothetical protein n=1 Tax=Pseudonocardia sp. TRM90224 TaxID=2812678 RepID=UPI001E4A42CD|nr:hypothetical protein [Pseudonocardia sp. TRM90224]